jgi:hypothetical protein
MPTYADQLMAVALVAAGQDLVTRHLLSSDQLNTAAGAVVSLVGVAWAVFAANPSRPSPIVSLLALLKRAPGPEQARWNAAIEAAAAALVPRIEAAIDARIRAKAGLLAGPIDAIANHEITHLADAAETAVTLPQP